MTDPLADLRINAAAQLSILESCRLNNPGIKDCLCRVRGRFTAGQIIFRWTRDTRLQAIDVNGINKIAGESYHLLYHRVHRIRASALRLTNTYGPGMRVKDARQTFLGIWIRRLIDGEPIQVYRRWPAAAGFQFYRRRGRGLAAGRGAIRQPTEWRGFNVGALGPRFARRIGQIFLFGINGGRGNYALVPFPADREIIDIGDYYADFRKINPRRDRFGGCLRVRRALG